MKKPRTEIWKDGKVVFKDVEIASSYKERMKGLSGRKSIGCGGLLFVFNGEGRHSIWMPNMKFPIDIIYISKGKEVVDVKHEALPISADPRTWKIFRPGEKAKYILEVPAKCAKDRIRIGDLLQFDIPAPKPK